MEIKDKAGKGQGGEEDKGLQGLEGKGQEGDDSKGQEGDASNNQAGNDDNGFEGKIHADDDGHGHEYEYSNGRGGEDPAGDGQGSKEKVAAAPAAKWSGKIDNKSNVKRDKDGHPMVVGDTVMCYARKQKDKYDNRVAKVECLNTDRAVVTILEGLAQGEKRKVEYRWLELWPSSKKKLFAGGVSSCKPLEIPLRQAMSGQWRRAPRRLTPCATV